MSKIFSILFFTILSLSAFSQELKINNGKKQKTIKAGSFLEVTITDVNTTYKEGDCCNNYSYLEGTIKKIEGDSIVFQVKKLQHFKTIDQSQISEHYYSPNSTTTINTKVALENIASIRKYKSLKSRKKLNSIQGFGGMFIVTGLITSLNALLVKDKTNKRNVFIIGVSQIGFGITLASIGHSKKYNFRAQENPWVIQK